jgi:hypothetical protein
MFVKILAVSALSLGMATAVLAQESGNGHGSPNDGGAATGGATTGSGSNNGGTSVDPGTTGSTSNGSNANSGTSNGGGRSQDCNGMVSGKNTTNMKMDQMNKDASADCK